MSQRKITISKVEQRNEEKRLSTTKYSVYTITCTPSIIKGFDIAVCRRYNDFRWLRKLFIECFPAIYIPPIPSQKMVGRFHKSFIEHRKTELQRFLNRICGIKPLADSFIFVLFLSKPENIFNVSKNEMIRAHIPSIKEKMHCLIKLFPSFCVNDKCVKQYIESTEMNLDKMKKENNEKIIINYKQNADKIIFGQQINESFVFLKKVCQKMNKLCQISKNINTKLFKLKHCSKEFHEAFWSLNSSQNELFKKEKLEFFGNDKRDFYAWYTHNDEMYKNEQEKYISLRRQYMDFCAFMDLFSNRSKYLSQFESVLSRNEKWQNLMDADYHLQPHQITQIQMDFKQEKLLRHLLLIMTKVMLNFNISEHWKQSMNDFKQMLAVYAQKQLMSHQMFYAECYNEDEDADEEDGDEISVTESYKYEPVFDANDKRQHSHRIDEDEDKQNADDDFILLDESE